MEDESKIFAIKHCLNEALLEVGVQDVSSELIDEVSKYIANGKVKVAVSELVKSRVIDRKNVDNLLSITSKCLKKLGIEIDLGLFTKRTYRKRASPHFSHLVTLSKEFLTSFGFYGYYNYAHILLSLLKSRPSLVPKFLKSLISASKYSNYAIEFEFDDNCEVLVNASGSLVVRCGDVDVIEISRDGLNVKINL